MQIELNLIAFYPLQGGTKFAPVEGFECVFVL